MADSQWDAEDYVAKDFSASRVTDKWEGEDEDDDVKDNWDDEEEEPAELEPKKEAESEAKLVQVKKKNVTKTKLKAKLERLEEKAAEATPKTEEEAYEEKMRRQKLQEESDLELAKEAFGTNDIKTNIDSMDPTSREDFESLKRALVEKLTRYERTAHYLPFLEDLFRDLCINLDSDDIKKLGSTLNALSSEKAKAAKASKTKKKASTKKASLVVGKASDYDFVEDYGGGDEFDDFM